MADPFASLRAELHALQKVDEAFRVAAFGTHAQVDERIHGKGQAADGSKIGNYSTKPAYFNPDKSPVKFAPKGKTGKKQFKDGRPHKTAYFEAGYKGLRKQVGRQVEHVDARFTGQLQQDFTIQPDGNGYGSGFNNPDSPDKADGIETRFKKPIWSLSDQEVDDFFADFESELSKRL